MGTTGVAHRTIFSTGSWCPHRGGLEWEWGGAGQEVVVGGFSRGQRNSWQCVSSAWFVPRQVGPSSGSSDCSPFRTVPVGKQRRQALIGGRVKSCHQSGCHLKRTCSPTVAGSWCGLSLQLSPLSSCEFFRITLTSLTGRFLSTCCSFQPLQHFT